MLPSPGLAQFGAVPNGSAPILVALSAFVTLALALWVGFDATDHSDHPLVWALATLVAGASPVGVGSIAVAVLYHRTRPELGSIAPPSVRREGEIECGEVLGEAVDRRRRAGSTDGWTLSTGNDLGEFESAEPIEEDG